MQECQFSTKQKFLELQNEINLVYAMYAKFQKEFED